MTVAELVNELLKHDPNHRVLVNGYEGGYNDVAVSGPWPFGPNPEKEWYYGRWERADDEYNETTYDFTAIVLRGTNT